MVAQIQVPNIHVSRVLGEDVMGPKEKEQIMALFPLNLIKTIKLRSKKAKYKKH